MMLPSVDLICKDQELEYLPQTYHVLSLCPCMRKITKTQDFISEKKLKKIFGSFTRASADSKTMTLKAVILRTHDLLT